MLPAAGSGDGGAHGALGSCWEPQDSHTGTAGSHHLQAQPQPRMWGRVQSEGGSSQEPGRARWVPSAAFREVFLQKLKLHHKKHITASVWAAVRSCVPAEAAPGREEQDFGHLDTCARTTVSHRAPRGHTRPPLLLLLPDPVRAWPRHPGEQRLQVTSAGLSRGASTANAKCHHNYKAPAAAPASAPELLHQPCTRPAREGGQGQRLDPSAGTCSGFFRASNPSGSVQPGISRTAWAGGRLLQSCHCYFWASPVLFSLDTRCFRKEMGLPCTLSP